MFGLLRGAVHSDVATITRASADGRCDANHERLYVLGKTDTPVIDLLPQTTIELCAYFKPFGIGGASKPGDRVVLKVPTTFSESEVIFQLSAAQWPTA
jgi:hypothetical protein